jgi:glycerate kinase
MNIICAPDSFKESLTAVEAVESMVAGIRSVLPDAQVDRCPVGDGGEGTLESLLVTDDGVLTTLDITGALGDRRPGQYGLFENGLLGWVESASAIGLAAIPVEHRNVMKASSFGVGELILAAASKSPERIVIGVGGSSTNDGGCGMAQALGICFMDEAGRKIEAHICGGGLLEIAAIDLSARKPVPAQLLVACDVNNPMTGTLGAAAVYGPQKGASADDVKRLEAGLEHLAKLIRRDVGTDVENLPGAGAAGGLGGGLVAFAGAKPVSGVQLVLEATQFEQRVRKADLCLTGEGRLDEQSLSGKTCMGVAAVADAAGVPVIALVGSIGPGADKCLDAGLREYVAIGEGLPLEQAMRDAPDLLSGAAARIAGRYL